MNDEIQSGKPAKTKRPPNEPPPNLDLFGDFPAHQPPEKTTERTVEKLGPSIRRLQLKLCVS